MGGGGGGSNFKTRSPSCQVVDPSRVEKNNINIVTKLIGSINLGMSSETKRNNSHTPLH